METVEEEKHKCPKCGQEKGQVKKGFNLSGTQRYKCKDCGVAYTPKPKRHEYPDEVKQQALKTYYSGVSGRAVGKYLA